MAKYVVSGDRILPEIQTRLDSHPDFSRYNDPARALRIWRTYATDLLEHPEYIDYAEALATRLSDCDRLDAALDRTFYFRRPVLFVGNHGHSLNGKDEDANGSLSNAKMALEESY